MIGLFVRRLIQLPPTLLVTSALMFLILSMGPSPLAQMQEFANLSAQDIARMSAQYGWDKPLYEQYFRWLGGFVTGDWGESIRTFTSASEMIFERLPLTLIIASCSLIISVGIGVPIGAYVALRRYSRVDYITTLITLLLMAMPGFFIALVLQIIAVKMRQGTGDVWFYTSGIPEEGATFLEWVQRLALPVLTLALAHIAIWVRYQRAELLGVLSQEYIRCARAKGLPNRVVFLRHAMRNAVLPIITLVAIDMGKLCAGAVIVEAVFNLPGVGTLLYESIKTNDSTVILDIMMLIAAMMVISNAVADTLYGVIDPRAREAT